MQTAFISHPACLKHDMGGYHPESPARLAAIEDQLIAGGVYGWLQRHDAPRASREQLARVHRSYYIDKIEAAAPREGIVYLDPDTAMNPFTLEAALRAAGAAVLGADLVMSGTVENAFCSIRPPGHHASRDQAMGFCLFNNVAVGVAHALAVHGLERVAIADFDVHHGNGTEDIFADDARVMLCSTFQHPFYPHSGAGGGNEHIINVPLRAGTNGVGFRAAVWEHWLPALEAFQPQMLFISAGFDAHVDDDMSGLALVEADYVWVTQKLKAVAQAWGNGRIVSVLEGGYDLSALGRSVAAHIKVLSGL
ncbi:MAG: histone deacetylase family protein [Gammaproteobacteria bacterium]